MSQNDINAMAQKQIDALNVEEIKEELAKQFLGFDVVGLKVGLVKRGRYLVTFTRWTEKPRWRLTGE